MLKRKSPFTTRYDFDTIIRVRYEAADNGAEMSLIYQGKKPRKTEYNLQLSEWE